MDQGVESEVYCYSGMSYADRPRAFLWNGKQLSVVEIQTSLRTPYGKRFRVLAEDDNLFVLAYNEVQDSWRIQPL